jgi:RNA polymerase sigma-70 factor (ECF subfamily)
VTALPHSADPRAAVEVPGLPQPTVGFEPAPSSGYAAQQPRDWVRALGGSGRERDEALAQLHALMLRAAHHQMSRMRSMVPGGSARVCDDIANAAADEAMTALLSKLDTFEGRSRFTTWAYKFAILQVATEVRRQAWSGREVSLEDVGGWGDPSGFASDDSRSGRWGDNQPGPDLHAEGADLAEAVAAAMRQALTPYQRRIAVALLVDQVPVDVLADRLGTTRGALYKTLHMARGRIRAHLVATGHLPATAGPPPLTDGVGR